MPDIRVLTSGPAVTRWLALAKKWARQTFASGIRNKVWTVADATIRVENYPEANLSKVWIAGERAPVGYQFFGTERHMLKIVQDPAVPGRYLPVGNWTWVKLLRAAGDPPAPEARPKALLSSLRASADQEWAYQPNPQLGSRRLVFAPVHQPDGMGVRTWRDPRNAALPWLATAWAEPWPCHGAYRMSGGVAGVAALYDRGYDFAPTVFAGRRGAVVAPESDWYRGACIRVVDSTFGSRRYIIMVDVDQVFHCYPIAAAGERLYPLLDPNKANVLAQFVRSRPAPLPAWAHKVPIGRDAPMTAREYASTPMPRWEFSPLGDKAAAVIFERDAPFADAHLSSARYAGTGALIGEVREDWPALLEVAFEVVPTGDGLGDFDFRVTVRKERRGKTDGRGYLAVGYAGRDFDDLPGEVKYNDLLVLEHRYRVGNMFQPAQAYDAPDQGFVVADPTYKVLISPPLAAIAAITREGDEVEGRDVMTWLSSFVARWGRFDEFSAADRFTPTFDQLADKPAEPATVQNFSLQTTIHGLDLPSLTVSLSTAVTLTGICGGGFVFPDGETLVQWGAPHCASAATLSLYSLGVLEHAKTVGHPQLSAAIPLYRDLLHPAVHGLARVDLRAKIDHIAFHPDWEDTDDLTRTLHYRVWQFAQPEYYPLTRLQFANVTLIPGIDGAAPVTGKIMHSMTFAHWRGHAVMKLGTPNLYDNGLRQCPLFPDLYVVMVPTVYTLFDSAWLVRPGIRWVRSDGIQPQRDPNNDIIVEPGASDVMGYPLGAVLHARFAPAALAGLTNPHTGLAAHVNGSYATFVGPVAAPQGVVAMHPNIEQPVAALPGAVVEGIKQVSLDVIRARWGPEERRFDVQTTHVEQMKQAFDLALVPEDYHLHFSVTSGKLRVSPQTAAPFTLQPWRVHHPSEYDTQYLNGSHGEAGIFSPIMAATAKTTYVNTSGGATFLVTMPAMNEEDMAAAPTEAIIAFPTPRVEGLFSSLPWKEKPA